jgi:hypothetical protein
MSHAGFRAPIDEGETNKLKIKNRETLENIKLVRVSLGLSMLLSSAPCLRAATPAEMRAEARAALNDLDSTTPAARHLGESAKGILVLTCRLNNGTWLLLAIEWTWTA